MRKLVLASLVLIAGCSTQPRSVLIPTPAPCRAAQELPEQPDETLTLDATKPGEAVKAYAANRASWIGYGKSLRTRLESCK